ncbi:MAG: META domain-containing protein [Opitutae bacterium]|jgi:heat shock protein HslJ|nr:META domain-containing protein [Opitutae bacterium]
MNRSRALLLITTALILCGCASTPKSISGNYALVTLSNTDTTLEKSIIMHVRENGIAGSGPVNRWQATIDDGEIGPMISTRRAGPPHLMQYESDLLTALEGAKFDLDGRGKLTFKQKRDVTAVFEYVEISPDTFK